jgi:hypothetical protein
MCACLCWLRACGARRSQQRTMPPSRLLEVKENGPPSAGVDACVNMSRLCIHACIYLYKDTLSNTCIHQHVYTPREPLDRPATAGVKGHMLAVSQDKATPVIGSRDVQCACVSCINTHTHTLAVAIRKASTRPLLHKHTNLSVVHGACKTTDRYSVTRMCCTNTS